MEILISRILKYLNGCLNDDHMYRIGSFVVKHYNEICQYDLEQFIKSSKCFSRRSARLFLSSWISFL